MTGTGWGGKVAVEGGAWREIVLTGWKRAAHHTHSTLDRFPTKLAQKIEKEKKVTNNQIFPFNHGVIVRAL